MIKLENYAVEGFSSAIRGMRNPMNSWIMSDSNYVGCPSEYKIGKKDEALMRRLINAGPEHCKFRRMIVVWVDITAPLYWWKEFDTYKVGTVANSCSTMHKIQSKKFDISDFSTEHLINDSEQVLNLVIEQLNLCRDLYLETNDKKWWWQMIQMLPSSYNQKRTVMLSYEVLANIYKPGSRLHHKLDEWSIDGTGASFCKWIEKLPFSWIITGKE